MNLGHRLAIRTRILLSFLAISAAAPVIGVTAAAAVWWNSVQTERFTDSAMRTMAALSNTRAAALELIIATDDYLGATLGERVELAFMDISGLLQTARRARLQLGCAAALYRALEETDDGATAAAVADAAAELMSASGEAIAAAGTARAAAAAGALESREESFGDTIELALRREREEMTRQRTLVAGRLRGGMMLEVGLVVAACAGAVIAARRLARSVTRPIAALGRGALEYGQGNFSAAIDVRSNDEFGALARGMEEMARGLKRSYEDVDRARAEAEAANRAKSDFLANMSHEIRTPMTAILGYAEMLQGSASTEQERVEFLRVIRRNGDHLLSVINDILDISKIEAGKFELSRTRCSLCQIVGEVAATMRVRAAEKSLRLGVEFVFPVPETIESDPLRVRQVLVNLVGNAVKFTERGGVNIRVRADAIARGTPLITVEVADTGIGLTAEQASALFQPFTQADTSVTRKYGGTGLGLTISRRLARMLGGDITFAPAPEGGSVFTFTLATGDLAGVRMIQNAQEAVVPPTAEEAALPEVQLSGRVLLAEDGTDNQRLISFILRKAGAQVQVVENGSLAVRAAQVARQEGRPFSLILMDMQMPVMDGYEASRTLRAAGEAAPIIALTAHAMSGDREKCLAAGCDDYAGKPINRRALVEACARWLQRRSTRGPTPQPPAANAAA